MIVRMNKVTLLCMASAQDQTLEALRKLGVVHLSHVQAPGGESLEDVRAYRAEVHRALESLSKHPLHGRPSGKSGAGVVDDIGTFLREKKRLTEERDTLRQERLRIEPFGNVDPAAVAGLEAKGLCVGLFKVPAGEEVVVPQDAVFHEARRDKNHRWYAVVGRSRFTMPGEAVRVPDFSLAEIDRRLAEAEKALEENTARLAQHARDYHVVAQFAAEVDARVTYLEARTGMGMERSVAYLRGYCPESAVKALREASAGNGWGLIVEEPAAEDNAPTLIRNPRWIRIIQPVFDFMGIAPGYHEVDISACFLFFFSIFFGMIVGDAGYGLIFLVLTLAGRRGLKKASPLMVPLLLLMSACTIAWGLLTGTFFSMSRLPAVLGAAKVDWLRDHHNVMFLCFAIGAVHITIAHAWNALRTRNTPQALAQVGWICNTWAMFFVTCMMVLGHEQPGFLVPLLLTGVLLIALFMTPFRMLKSAWFNHVMLPLDLISNFVDVISYVRLFAVGLATFAVGNAFNGMAVGGGVEGLVAGLLAALVLFAGHTLNMVMAAMGVLVHGIRLNTLEFSGHLGMQWTGIKYVPFAEGPRN